MAGLPEAGEDYGRYRLLSELSRGESSRVFITTDPDTDTPLALKVVLPPEGGADELRERLTRGAAKVATVRSRHVAAVLAVGQVEDTVFIATEHCEVGDLDTRLKTQGHLSRPQALRLVAAVCQGLDDAERAGLAHGNLKPSNILLAHEEEGLHPYVTDFVAISPRGTTTPPAGSAPGLLAYVAPETLLGRTSDVRSDVYSLGCVLVAALTGHPPYQGSALQVMQGHVRGEVPRLHVKDAVDEAVNDLLAFTLAKDPVDRVQRLPELRDALLALSEGHLPHEGEEDADDSEDATAVGAAVLAPVAPGGTQSGPWWAQRTTLKVAAGFAAGLLLGGTLTALMTGDDGSDPVTVSALASPTASPTATPTVEPSKKPKPRPRAERKPKPKPKPAPLPATAEATGLTGDYTGDGRGDLLLTRRDGGTSTVLLSAGKSRFLARDLSTLGFPDSRTVRGDFDGDGGQDLLELAPEGANAQARVWASDGAAPIVPGPWRHTNLVWNGLTVTAGDVDGDGTDDLVSETPTDLQVTRLTGDGPLTAESWGTRAVPTLVEGIIAGDFSGDGLADVLEYADNGAGVTLHLHSSTGSAFEPPQNWGTQPEWRLQSLDVVVGDFDGDGTTDLAAAPKPAAGGFKIQVLLSSGSGLAAPSDWTSSGSVSWDATRIVAGDFDGDGRTDIASLEQRPQGLAVGVRRSLGSEFDSVEEWGDVPGVPWSRDAAAGSGD